MHTIPLIRVLLVEDSPADAATIRILLGEATTAKFQVDHCTRLGKAIEMLSMAEADGHPMDVVVLDLGLPDCDGIETFHRAQEAAEHLPIVVLTGHQNEQLAPEAIRHGAQDYLAKGHIESELLARALLYAIDRKQAEHELTRLQEEISERLQQQQQQVAQALHDDLGQQLTGIGMMVKSLEHKLAKENSSHAQTAGELATVIAQARRTTSDLAAGLYPVEVDAESLIPAMAKLVDDTRRQCEIACQLQTDVTSPVGDDRCAMQLYRIAREALSNAVKHAASDRVSVELTALPDGVRLAVRDHGQGLPPDRPIGLGMRIMKYRAKTIGAELRVESQPGHGTTVVCQTHRRRSPTHEASAP